MYIRTGVRAAKKAGSHANFVRPANGIDSNETSDEWRVEKLIAFDAFVRVAAELL